MHLDDLFRELDDLGTNVTLEALTDRLAQVEVDLGAVSDHVVFAREGYRRNLVHRGPGYEALLLCWRPGQRSPIHDHQGSACGVVALTGTATETVYERTDDGLFTLAERTLETGQVCGSEDADIHEIANLAEHRDLVTLHIYAPPLDRYRVYTLEDGASCEVRAKTHGPRPITA